MRSRHAILAALAALPLAALAQEGWTEIEDEALMIESLGMTVGELDGAPVYDAAGERIGELDDVLMGADGTSMAASLDVGGFLGIGERDVVLPLGDLTPSDDGFALDMTREALEALPEFVD